MRLEVKEFMPAGSFTKVQKWAAAHSLPRPWLMQVHPDNYPVKTIETRIVFDMPNGRQEMIRSEDWIALTADGQIHGVDWLDVEKNYELKA